MRLSLFNLRDTLSNYPTLAIALIFIAFTTQSCGEEEPEPTFEEFIVTPGQSLNDISIGDSGSSVASFLGGGYTEISNAFGDGDAIFYMQYSNLGIQFSMEIGPEDSDVENLDVNQISFYGSFNGMTTEGVKLGSTLEEVEAAYGEGVEDSFGTINYASLGIFLDYDQEKKVDKFTIYKP